MIPDCDLGHGPQQFVPESLDPRDRRDEQQSRRRVHPQPFKVGDRLVAGKPGPELRLDQHALAAVPVEAGEIPPLALLPCCLGPHLGDFAHRCPAGCKQVGQGAPCSLRPRQNVAEGGDGEVFGLRAEHRRELRKQRPVVSGHRSILLDHGVG